MHDDFFFQIQVICIQRMKKIRTQKNLIGSRQKENILLSFVTKTKMEKWIGYVMIHIIL